MKKSAHLTNILLVLAITAGLAACGRSNSDSSNASTVEVKVSTISSNLEHPWGLAFLPDGSMLVTERPGRLRHVSTTGLASAAISGVPAVDARGQGGLFDVLIDPGFSSNRRIYFSYAEAGTGADAGKNGLAVARAELASNLQQLNNVSVIFRQTPKVASTAHFGGRLVWAADGKLFITLGDRQLDSERGKAQDLSTHHGKIVRINSDGSVPADNPFLATPGALPEIWSLGHRNIQGAALHPVSGELWTSEHGPQGGDEINIARAGKNYGWPVVTYGCEYGTCTPIGEGTHKDGMEDPLTWWVPTSIAPSGLAFYSGKDLPDWQGDLFSGALAGKALWRLRLKGNSVSGREALLGNLDERLRAVVMGPDGHLYLLTDADKGRILRLDPR
ncbi:MAG: PQQ-dependent sugar dehydrogenase [Pedobacter sp.]|nr:PQQ-dependent sugar dehydrogenase [Pedobacter sp.]